MGGATHALESASRRDLQALAKELQLCRGNAKSDVIISHAVQFIKEHPADGEARVLAALGAGSATVTVASPAKKSPKKTTPKKQSSVKVESAKKSEKQSDDEPVEKKTPTKQEKVGTPSKKQEKAVTPLKKQERANEQKKAEQTASPAVKSPKPVTKATKLTPERKIKPSPAKVETVAEVKTPTKKEAVVDKKAVAAARKAVEALVKATDDLTFVGETRVRCSTTGHEMKADLDTIKTHINGKRYQKARDLKWSIASYAPMFVAHPDESKKDLVWCNVTETAIIRNRKSVEKHIAAPKYQRQLPIWREQEAAKKKAEEEEAQRRAARIEAAKKRRLAAASEGDENSPESERPAKRAATASSKKYGA